MNVISAPSTWSILLAGFLVGLGGCSNPEDMDSDMNVETEFGPGSIAGFAPTFDWMPSELVSDPGLANEQLHEYTKSIIEREFKAKGYTLKPGRDGFWVAYRVVAERVYQDVWLSISAFLPQTKERLFSGSVKADLDLSRDPAEKRARIETAVARILAEFPPRQEGAAPRKDP